MSKEYLDIETLEKNLKLDTDIRRQQEQCEKKIETYQKKQQTYQKGISQAYLDRVSGILTEKEYLELTEEFRQGKQQSEKLMESEKKRLTELTERLEKGDERGKRILKYINPEFLTKEIVEELIDHIVVGKKSKETGEIPWRYIGIFERLFLQIREQSRKPAPPMTTFFAWSKTRMS